MIDAGSDGRPSRPRLLLNPRAGRARRAIAAAAALDVEVVETADPERLDRELRHAIDAGEERVLVGGGDGTLHRAIQTLAGSACALGPIPLGSGNDLARALAIPLRPSDALHRALHAPARSIDLGRAGGRWFAGVAGVGIDGQVNAIVRGWSGPRGPWVYPLAGLRALARSVPLTVELVVDGRTRSDPVTLVAIANSPIYGGGMRIAPQASLSDGHLDVVVVRAAPAWRVLPLLPLVYLGRHVGSSLVRIEHARRVVLRAPDNAVVHVDGEPLGGTGEGLTIDVHAAALRVVV